MTVEEQRKIFRKADLYARKMILEPEDTRSHDDYASHFYAIYEIICDCDLADEYERYNLC